VGKTGRKYRSAYGLNRSMHERPATSSTARPSSGSKSTRSARSRTGLLSASRLAVAGRRIHSERQTASAPRRRARPAKLSPSRAHTVTVTRGLRSEHVCTAPTIFPVHPCRTSHRLRTWHFVREWLVVGRGIFDAVVHDEECYYKPTSTSGSDSGAQLTSLSPFNRVCKLQKRDESMSRRGTRITMSFMRAIHDVFCYS